eukprot:Protomagalhaensia_wolfi_Nauph_80__1539@NODE_193_length_3230_cov_39_615168_g146_i0_p1_GENE_NODE_193_length_3230_cov_39_615168_g146_i0NODE_193_length_3230_cov_39_615168_g146_i0_p1_ORF_typecomplete_len544_score72_93PUB/PF09409_10/2_1e12UBX/PF00789_20/5_4e03UBX/PF00789_20/8_9e06Rad60SLD_2/PF13881_6/7_5e03Rad60SLD_2/PF13881_6/0_11Linker_histone/PF00538_19/0_19PaaX/PF07848_12/0_46_NODE_193_length_3230_cov_39_615168_g146_i07672398
MNRWEVDKIASAFNPSEGMTQEQLESMIKLLNKTEDISDLAYGETWASCTADCHHDTRKQQVCSALKHAYVLTAVASGRASLVMYSSSCVETHVHSISKNGTGKRWLMEKERVTSVLIEVGLELGRNEAEVRDVVTRLVDEEWYDTIEALKKISEEEWSQLKLPRRFYLKLREKLDNLPDVVESAEPYTEVNLAPPNPDLPWTDIMISECIKALCSNSKYSREEILESLKSLYKLISAILKAPKDASKRKIRKGNPNFQAKVGSKPEALRVLMGVGFGIEQENNEEFLTLAVAFMSRLTDAFKLLETEIVKLGGSVPQSSVIKTTGFNPYTSNLATTRSDSQRLQHPPDQDIDPFYINAQVARERKLRATGGIPQGVQIPINKVIYPSMKAAGHPPRIQADCESGDDLPPPLTPAELARLKETLSGNRQFRSAGRERLEALRNEPVYAKTCLRIIGPDGTVLQMEFRPNTRVADVYAAIWNEGLSRTLKALIHDPAHISLLEPPNRPLDPSKTLYQQRLVPNATLRLKLPPQLERLVGVRSFE